MGVNEILFVALSGEIRKTQQQYVFPKTMPGLLWFIYRPRCELLSFKLFSPENIVPIKLFTAKSVAHTNIYISKFSLKQDYVILEENSTFFLVQKLNS